MGPLPQEWFLLTEKNVQDKDPGRKEGSGISKILNSFAKCMDPFITVASIDRQTMLGGPGRV